MGVKQNHSFSADEQDSTKRSAAGRAFHLERRSDVCNRRDARVAPVAYRRP